MTAGVVELPAAIAELTKVDRWVLHNAEKVPLRPSGEPASTTDPTTWSRYDDVAEPLGSGAFAGLGFVFNGDGYVGIDLDHCLDPEGRPSDLALEIVNAIGSYTEVSPSGSGLHILVKGEVSRALRRDDVGVEVYGQGRYFTVTGNLWADSPSEKIEERPAELRALLARFAPQPTTENTGSADGAGKIREGGRHNALVTRAARLRKLGLSEIEVTGALSAFNADRCDPPLLESEMLDIGKWSNENVEPEAIEPARRTWDLLWADEADGSRGHAYVVDDVIHMGTIGEVYGEHGTLKTMAVLDIGAHVAQGIPWRGHKTQRGGVVYVAAEGGGGIEGRIAALRASHPQLPPRSLVAVRSAVNLLDADTVDAFSTWLLENVIPEMPDPLAFIVFDTLSQSMPGGEENPGSDFTAAESRVRDLLTRLGQGPDERPAACLVHHAGKDASRGPRGHSSQLGNLDWILGTERVDGNIEAPLDQRLYTLRASKVKDGPDGVRWGYRGGLVKIGTRDDGRVRCAPMVRAMDDLPAAKASYTPKPGSLPDRILAAMAAIQSRDGAQIVPPEVLRGAGFGRKGPCDGVLREVLLDYLARGDGRTDGSHDATSARRVNEALGRLEDKRKVKAFEGWVWWLD